MVQPTATATPIQAPAAGPVYVLTAASGALAFATTVPPAELEADPAEIRRRFTEMESCRQRRPRLLVHSDAAKAERIPTAA